MHTHGLYHNICTTYRQISFDAFNRHLKRLVSEKLVSREDAGLGKKVKYSLTEKAKQRRRLKILELKSPKEKQRLDLITTEQKRKNLFILLLLFRQKCCYKFETEEAFENFLLQFDLAREDLSILGEPNHTTVDRDRKIYYKTTIFRSPEKDITIIRRQNTFRRDSKKGLVSVPPSISYDCSIKGLTIRDILNPKNRPAFGHLNLTLEEVEEAFKTLFEEKLLKPMNMYNIEVIYEIADNSLEHLLESCLEIYEFVYGTIYGIWRFIRKPTEEEIDWLEFFKGIADTSRIRNKAYNERHTARPKKKTKEWLKWYKGDVRESEKSLDEMVTDLNKNHAYTIKRYGFSSEDILEIVYPKFLHETFSHIG
jgi:hypothetical protein